MGMALLPSAVERLPTHQLWGPNAPWRRIESGTKVAVLVFSSFSRTGHISVVNEIPS